eukprot:Hpha_TRINITY_DN34527_c0_g1::TRINITY_DN34527_c0_g1_i1::g.96310::m.96310
MCPHGMHEALNIHNTLLRGLVRKNNGYEVKVIGDALMVAFSRALNAVDFALAAQLGLVQSEWPGDLCSHPLCRRAGGTDSVPLWHGLRVRIGVNWGPARVERNPITGRYDYFGATVNTAARVEAALKLGGLSGMTGTVMNEVGPELRSRGDVFIAEMGALDLKGVAAKVPVSIVLPRCLAQRWQGGVDSDALLVENLDPGTPPAALSVPLVESSLFSTPHAAFRDPGLPGMPPLGEDHRGSLGSEATSTSNSMGRSVRSAMGRSGFGIQSAHSRLALGLEISMASCSTVRGTFAGQAEDVVTESLSDMLVAAETAASRTQGVVVCVVSSLCVTSWNA